MSRIDPHREELVIDDKDPCVAANRRPPATCGGSPEVVELRLEMPADLELDYDTELAQERIAERVKAREHRAWQRSKRTGMAFAALGACFAKRPPSGPAATRHSEASIRSLPRRGTAGPQPKP